MASQIPLTSDGEQLFIVTLSDRQLAFRVRYNTRQGLWYLDLSDADTGESLVYGVAMAVGINILEQYHLGLGGLWVLNEVNPTEEAGPTNLGTDIQMYHLTEDEIDSV